MAPQKKHIGELHSEIKEWKSAAELIVQETTTLNKQLASVANENTHEQVRAQVEHFQNMFIRQAEVNDTLIHNLKRADHHLTCLVQANPIASDRRLTQDNPTLRDEAQTHTRLFTELKHDFNRFAAEWL